MSAYDSTSEHPDSVAWERVAAVLLAGQRRGRLRNVPRALQDARDLAPAWCPPPLQVLYRHPPLARMSWALAALGGNDEEIGTFLGVGADLVARSRDQVAEGLGTEGGQAVIALRVLVSERRTDPRGRPFPEIVAAIILVAGLLLLTVASPLVTGPVQEVSSNPPGQYDSLDSLAYGPSGAALLELTPLTSSVLTRNGNGTWQRHPVKNIFQVSTYLGPTWQVSWYANSGSALVPGPFVEDPAPLGWPIGSFVVSSGRLWSAAVDQGTISFQTSTGHPRIHPLPTNIDAFQLFPASGGGAIAVWSDGHRIVEWLLNWSHGRWQLTSHQAVFRKIPDFLALGADGMVVMLAGRHLFTWMPGPASPVEMPTKVLASPQYLETYGQFAWVVGPSRAELLADAGGVRASVDIPNPNAVGVLPSGTLWVESNSGVQVYVPR
ncbi:MAG: hypothetical protein ACP5QO_13845 [Clostridia bacterium]